MMGPCPSCGNWLDGDYCCYSCGWSGGAPAAPPVVKQPPTIPPTIGVFDSYLGMWQPAAGKKLELQELLGADWQWCEYYTGFFKKAETA